LKNLPCILAAAALLTGCTFSNGSQKMSADKLSQIKPGVTTRADLIQWFGSPVSQGLDESGQASFNWYHAEATSGLMTVHMKNQMLTVIMTTNDVVKKFVLTDDLNPAK